MNGLKKIYTNLFYPKLTKIAKESASRVTRYKEDNAFNSKVMKELLTDAFEYSGKERDVLLVKDRTTGKPVELFLQVRQEACPNKQHTVKETYTLVDLNKNRKVGEKYFHLKHNEDGTYSMFDDYMENGNCNYSGVGIRLDQIQMERAFGLGIENIERTSLPQAIIYHTKMGFVPIEKNMEAVKSAKQVMLFAKENVKMYKRNIVASYFKPVLVQKDGKFYIDENKTLALASYDASKDILKKSKYHRIITDIAYFHIAMELKDKALLQWKKIITERPILAKLGLKLNNNF